MFLLGCGQSVPQSVPNGGTGEDPGYIGSATCLSCHSGLAEPHALHGHANALSVIDGTAPLFPESAVIADVPNPPADFEWTDIAWVIGGYTKAANFVDRDGFLLTAEAEQSPVRYSLGHPPTGTPTGFDVTVSDEISGTEFGFDCFRCHTTGAASVESNGGLRQGNRPGVGGTWSESGVQCEACHGPGSLHIPNPPAGNVAVDGSARGCGACHARDIGIDAIEALAGFIAPYQQSAELLAGPHAGLSCTVCHDPHISVVNDRQAALRNQCITCHPDANMAQHDGKIFVQGDYVERMNCESCHMPFATRSTVSATDAVTGGLGGRIGDVRSHVFSIDVSPRGFDDLLDTDGTRINLDANGKTAVTLDFVCMRCHNGIGRAFELTIDSASQVAQKMHDF